MSIIKHCILKPEVLVGPGVPSFHLPFLPSKCTTSSKSFFLMEEFSSWSCLTLVRFCTWPWLLKGHFLEYVSISHTGWSPAEVLSTSVCPFLFCQCWSNNTKQLLTKLDLAGMQLFHDEQILLPTRAVFCFRFVCKTDISSWKSKLQLNRNQFQRVYVEFKRFIGMFRYVSYKVEPGRK